MRANTFSLPSIHICAEDAVTIGWPATLDQVMHQHILQYQHTLRAHLASVYIDSVVGFHTLTVYFDFTQITNQQLITKLEQLLNDVHEDIADTASSKLIEIPTYYGAEAGIDIDDISQATGLSAEEIVTLHSQRSYHAYALGFTPGFCYLADIDSKLKLPRRASPRVRMPAGCVAIAEEQTAVYPTDSPGGWHIIGRTPLNMFSYTEQSIETTISVGDEVRFVPISKAEYLSLGGCLD
ncbi:5-oxoprolinase subunit PxpB [Thalassotalea euphylliae]|uniref:5-oxoprolinase subunit PxpB n=1 Tax=Thalassotalea euphylliae TaxID=1655234 RepID=UPI003629753C